MSIVTSHRFSGYSRNRSLRCIGKCVFKSKGVFSYCNRYLTLCTGLSRSNYIKHITGSTHNSRFFGVIIYFYSFRICSEISTFNDHLSCHPSRIGIKCFQLDRSIRIIGLPASICIRLIIRTRKNGDKQTT